MKNITTVILAAGRSTRFISNKSKLTHELAGYPIINHVFDSAKKVSGKNIIVVCNKDNFDELKYFFDNKWLKLLDIPNEYWVRDSDISPNWNWVINTLNINEYLISSWSFSDEIELELNELWIKRFITSTSQFWEAWGWPHCLTNEL